MTTWRLTAEAKERQGVVFKRIFIRPRNEFEAGAWIQRMRSVEHLAEVLDNSKKDIHAQEILELLSNYKGVVT